MIVASEQESAKKQIEKLEEQIRDMSKQEMREMLLINTYKLGLMRSQIEAISEVLIKRKLTTYEEIWKKTNENFKDANL